MNEQPDNSREETYREARKQIVRSAFLALAALGVIVFACYAWFVSSGTVTGTVGSVRIDGSSFELASEGGNGNWDEKLDGYAEPGETQPIDGLDLVTTGKENDIIWKISPKSNLENGKDQTGKDQTGISPGSHGQMQFYIIPKRDGELTLKVDVELIPLNKQGEHITMKDDETLNWLLRGHFLFSYECQQANGYNPENTPTLKAYNNKSFNLTFRDVKEDEPILVTLDWKWPEFMRDIINNDKDGSTVKGWMSEQPNHFFYNGKDENGNTIQIFKPTDKNFTSQFGQYNNYYNNADEYIGDNVQSLVLRLTAEET
ncbi:MAG: hypothetical protein PUK18_02210 [Firmicutes bacterium]|nr:hypothetical protein [Bacillota bacterium]MDY6160416.1 hypothetical protein [Candidatus Faecousia sp.]